MLEEMHQKTQRCRKQNRKVKNNAKHYKTNTGFLVQCLPCVWMVSLASVLELSIDRHREYFNQDKDTDHKKEITQVTLTKDLNQNTKKTVKQHDPVVP